MTTERVSRYAREEAERHGTSSSLVLSPSQKHADVRARKAVIRRLHLDGFSMSQIADWLGYFDHTTVSHHLRAAR